MQYQLNVKNSFFAVTYLFNRREQPADTAKRTSEGRLIYQASEGRTYREPRYSEEGEGRSLTEALAAAKQADDVLSDTLCRAVRNAAKLVFQAFRH